MLTKPARQVTEILEAFDLTRCAFFATQLAGCDPKTVHGSLKRREAGLPLEDRPAAPG